MGSRNKMTAFSLLEMLVAMAVLGLVSAILFSLISHTQKLVRQSAGRVEQFREARRALERIADRLSQASLHPYLDYVDASGNWRGNGTFTPASYAQTSDLRFVLRDAEGLPSPGNGVLIGQAVFFQAPLGFSLLPDSPGNLSDLNTIGFFLERRSEAPPRGGESIQRFTLCEMVEPAEELTIYAHTSGNPGYQGSAWYEQPLANTYYSRELARNVIGFFMEAGIPDSSGDLDFSVNYDSTPSGTNSNQNRLPRAMRLTLVTVDEASAKRISREGIPIRPLQNRADLDLLTSDLIARNLNHRVLEKVVPINASE